MKATQLGSVAIKSCLDRANVQPEAVEEVFMGCVLQVRSHNNYLKMFNKSIPREVWAKRRPDKQHWGRGWACPLPAPPSTR